MGLGGALVRAGSDLCIAEERRAQEVLAPRLALREGGQRLGQVAEAGEASRASPVSLGASFKAP